MSDCGCSKSVSVSNVLSALEHGGYEEVTEDEIIALLESGGLEDLCSQCVGAVDFTFEQLTSSFVRPGAGVTAPLSVCFPCRYTKGTYLLITDTVNSGLFEIIGVYDTYITIKEYGGAIWRVGGGVFDTPRVIPVPLPVPVVTSGTLTVTQTPTTLTLEVI